jgi:hypothetical protein
LWQLSSELKIRIFPRFDREKVESQSCIVSAEAWAVEGNDPKAICLIKDTQSGGAVQGVFLGGEGLEKRKERGLDLR